MDNEDEFCRECGMEFPGGIEIFCPLCGHGICPACGLEGLSEDIDDECPSCSTELINVLSDEPIPRRENLRTQLTKISQENDAAQLSDLDYLESLEHCAYCREYLLDEDFRFQEFWFAFDHPAWLNMADGLCSSCIQNAIHEDYPELRKSGLDAATYLILDDARKNGVELSSKLNVIEATNAVERLHSVLLSRSEIIEWLNSDFAVADAEQWADISVSFEEAKKWRRQGFGPNDESIRCWIAWGCSPTKAAKLLADGLVRPPDVDYKSLKISLSDAIVYDSHGFSSDKFASAEAYIGTWLGAGLPPDRTVRLRDQIVERQQHFEDAHEQLVENVAGVEVPAYFWDYLPNQFEEMNALGLQITAENLEKYWGLTRIEILKVIDSGEDSGTTAELMRRRIPVRKAGIYEKLLSIGLSQTLSSSLIARGFSTKHLQHLSRINVVPAIPSRLEELLRWHDDMALDDVFIWVDFKGSVFEISRWLIHEFGPHDAIQWSNEGFDPDDARLWVDSGVTSPLIAKRRRDAGLRP